MEEHGQGGLLGGVALRAMAASFIGALRADITQGITPDALEDGWAGLRLLHQEQNDAWAAQFEWPEGY